MTNAPQQRQPVLLSTTKIVRDELHTSDVVTMPGLIPVGQGAPGKRPAYIPLLGAPEASDHKPRPRAGLAPRRLIAAQSEQAKAVTQTLIAQRDFGVCPYGNDRAARASFLHASPSWVFSRAHRGCGSSNAVAWHLCVEDAGFPPRTRCGTRSPPERVLHPRCSLVGVQSFSPSSKSSGPPWGLAIVCFGQALGLAPLLDHHHNADD
jgi:hypothetical protein